MKHNFLSYLLLIVAVALFSCGGTELVPEPAPEPAPGTQTQDDKPVVVDPVDPEEPQEPQEPQEPEEPQEPGPVGDVDLTALVGYGAGVTGGTGNGAKVMHFNSGQALQNWMSQVRIKEEKKGDHTPVTIWLSGTFGKNDGRASSSPWIDVKEVSNITLVGTDDFVMDQLGFFLVRSNNIIIRNINFRQPKADNGADAVSMQECDGVWVDHCTFTSLNQTHDYEDGSTDITHATKNVTVSWCHYINTQKSCLAGHSNNESGDKAITATFHHNWFDHSSSRHPRVRYGTVHVYNNLYDANTTYGVGSAYGAKVLVEYNYFDGLKLPTDICTYPAKDGNVSNLQGSVAGYLYAAENVYVNRPSTPANKDMPDNPYPLINVQYTAFNGSTITPLTYEDFKPSYEYTVTAAEDVPSVVKAGAGHGKLGYTSAPVEVDNGGIETPDPEEPQNPGDPGTPDTGAHTYTVFMQNKAVVQTCDGVAGGSYFSTSTSVADFSKDYSGSFTIGETTYSQGFKLDSGGYVKFTASASYNSTVQFYFARRKSDDSAAQIQIIPTGGTAQVFDTPYDTFADSGVITLQKGTEYTIKQKAKEQALILVVVKETEQNNNN